MSKWRVIHRELVLETPYFSVFKERIKLSNGREIANYFVMDLRDVVMVVPVINGKSLVMVKQYKHGVRAEMLEFPAGYREEGETIQEAAERELMEETGYAARTMEPLINLSVMPNRARQKIHVFVAEGLVGGEEQFLDPTEAIEVVTLPIETVVEKVRTGEIWASDTVAAAYAYVTKFQRGKKWQ